MKTVKEIIQEYLAANGFDGLAGSNIDGCCGCGLDDLMPCGRGIDECKPAHKVFCKDCPDAPPEDEDHDSEDYNENDWCEIWADLQECKEELRFCYRGGELRTGHEIIITVPPPESSGSL